MSSVEEGSNEGDSSDMYDSSNVNGGSSRDSEGSDSGSGDGSSDDGDGSIGNRSDGGDASSDSSSGFPDFSSSSDSSSGSSDFPSSGASASSSDDEIYFDEKEGEEDIFSSGAFEHCVLHFCSGEYDDEIRTALITFPRIIISTDGDAEAESRAREELESSLRWHVDTIESFSTIRRDVHFKVELSNCNGCGFIPRCESLDACWGDLSDALAANENVHLSNLAIVGVHLTGGVLDRLASSLGGRVERSLRFVRNDLHQDGIASIVPLLEENPTLLDLILCDNPITDSAATRRLFRAVEAHPNLRFVSLSGCRIGDDIPFLSCILNCGATQIALNCNGIGSEGGAAIAEHLEGDPPLEHLELDRNCFVDDDAVRLAWALKKNGHLKSIFLRDNRFSVDGAKTLFGAIFDASNMNAMSDCNHNCQVCLFSNHARVQQCIGYLNAEYREAARMTKLITMLSSSKEALLRCVEQVPLEFMPHVLALVQARVKEEKELLTMVYAVMRWWDMPSLYTYHQPECTRSKKKRKKKRAARMHP